MDILAQLRALDRNSRVGAAPVIPQHPTVRRVQLIFELPHIDTAGSQIDSREAVADMVGPYIEAFHHEDPEIFYDAIELATSEISDEPLEQGPWYRQPHKQDQDIDNHVRCITLDNLSPFIGYYYRNSELPQLLRTHQIISSDLAPGDSVMLTLIPNH